MLLDLHWDHEWIYSSSSIYGYPALSFIACGKIDGLIPNNETVKKKVKTISSAHEILHARGLTDLATTESECYDQVHGYHTEVLDCCMQIVSLSALNYPLNLCPFHENIIDIQLVDFIRTGVILTCPKF